MSRNDNSGDFVDKKMFVGSLSFDTTEDELRQYFERYGEVAFAVVLKDKVTNASRGYGFVTMENIEDFNKVLNIDHFLGNRQLKVSRAVKQRQDIAIEGETFRDANKLNLSGVESCSIPDLVNYFQMFGGIAECIKSSTGGFAFLTFERAVDAENVLKQTHVINGRHIDVKPSSYREGTSNNMFLGSKRSLEKVAEEERKRERLEDGSYRAFDRGHREPPRDYDQPPKPYYDNNRPPYDTHPRDRPPHEYDNRGRDWGPPPSDNNNHKEPYVVKDRPGIDYDNNHRDRGDRRESRERLPPPPSAAPVEPIKPPVDNRRIFVGNLHNTTIAEATEYFEHFGAVEQTEFKHDDAGAFKGYGFISYKDASVVEGIIKQSHYMHGKRLFVNYADQKSHGGEDKHFAYPSSNRDRDRDRERPHSPPRTRSPPRNDPRSYPPDYPKDRLDVRNDPVYDPRNDLRNDRGGRPDPRVDPRVEPRMDRDFGVIGDSRGGRNDRDYRGGPDPRDNYAREPPRDFYNRGYPPGPDPRDYRPPMDPRDYPRYDTRDFGGPPPPMGWRDYEPPRGYYEEPRKRW